MNSGVQPLFAKSENEVEVARTTDLSRSPQSTAAPEDEDEGSLRFTSTTRTTTARFPSSFLGSEDQAQARHIFMLSLVAKCLIICFLGGLLIFAIVQHDNLKRYLRQFLHWIEHRGMWGPVVMAVVYGLLVAFFFPVEILATSAGYIFTRPGEYGLFWGLLVATVTVECAYALSYLIDFLGIRFLLGQRNTRTGNDWLDAFHAVLREGGWRVLALVRLTPIVPFALSNCFLACTKVPFSHAFVTVPATSPFIFFTVYIGSCLPGLDAVSGGHWDWDTPHLLILLAMVAVTAGTVLRIFQLTSEQRRIIQARRRTPTVVGQAELEPLKHFDVSFGRTLIFCLGTAPQLYGKGGTIAFYCSFVIFDVG